MRRRCFTLIASTLLVLPGQAVCQPEKRVDERTVASLDSAFARLTAMHDTVKGVHPLLADLHPVAVVEGDSLLIFDTGSPGAPYRFQRKEPAPFPMQKGIRASFPLSCYGNTPTCVVSPEVFDTREGYATIFHEFVHCAQALSCENELKQTLHVATAAFAAKDYSWEINRQFPYGDSGFAGAYSRFLDSLRTGDSGGVRIAVRDLKRILPADDYEYMVWVEWKEGLARYCENRIRRLYGITPNLGGRERPYDRVSFYYGGEAMISYVSTHQPETLLKAEKLFTVMLALGDDK
jgi:hypothetical protein